MTAELDDIRSASANAIQLRDQNKSLRQRVIDMEREMNRVAMENRELASRANREWFVIGAAVLIVGMLLGIIVPRLKPPAPLNLGRLLTGCPASPRSRSPCRDSVRYW